MSSDEKKHDPVNSPSHYTSHPSGIEHIGPLTLWCPPMSSDEKKHDPVNSPSHYTEHPSGVECIEITRHMSFNVGNAVKYLWRAGLKDGATDIQDLEKAAWYIADEIAKRKKAAKKKRKEEKKAKEFLPAMIPPLPGTAVYDTTPPIGHITFTGALDKLIKDQTIKSNKPKGI